jgi:hypothetical protein
VLTYTLQVLPDSADEAKMASDPACVNAFVKITSIKPRVEVIGDGEGARVFTFSTPFTSSGKVRVRILPFLVCHIQSLPFTL